MMGRRFRVGTFFGIGLYIHWTFLLLLGWIAYASLAAGEGLQATGGNLLLMISLFGCVALHEYGHALAARSFGIPTTDITLLPIGGIARLSRMPRDPWQEMIVAVAGPAVNVAIALILLVGFAATGTLGTLVEGNAGYWQMLLALNVILVLFNSIPAFPMDGGRVLRALLAMFLDYRRATRAAARTGQVLAVVLGTVGAYWMGNPFLVLIAVFVFFVAGMEAKQVDRSETAGSGRVREAAVRQFRTIAADTPVVEVARLAADELQRDWPVTSGSRLCGMLLGSDVARAVREGRLGMRAGELMRTDVPVVLADDLLAPVLDHAPRRGKTLAVVDLDGRLVGLLDLPTVFERLELRRAVPAVPERRLFPAPFGGFPWPWSTVAAGSERSGTEGTPSRAAPP